MAVPTASSSSRSHNIFDSVLAALMVIAALWFAAFVYQRTGTGSLSAYEFSVRLPSAAGLGAGSDVRVGGLKIGTVYALELEPKSYRALIRLWVRSDLSLPKDSSAAVVIPALGSSYLSIAPGRSAISIKPGDMLSIPDAKPQAPPALAPSS
jgi:phospholipid/cholesterol/gamma-HCH transport system substrate-binding protein